MLRVFVCILVASFVATVSSSSLSVDSGKAGYCKIGDVYIKEGEKGAAPIGQCLNIMCLTATTNTHMGVGCGLMHPGSKCRMTKTDLTKRYPDCCPRAICNELIP